MGRVSSSHFTSRLAVLVAVAVVLALLAAVSILLVFAPTATAVVNVSRFSMTPSTTQAGGHPTLNVSVSFDPPTADVDRIALHLPPGLTANPRAAPFCPRGDLLADLCSLGTKLGTVTLTGEALGFEATAKRNIYNLKPAGSERLRLGVPIFGTTSRGGFAFVIPVNSRPGDNGLDLVVAGPPREAAGYAIRIKEVGFRIKGVIRRKGRRGVRRRALLTNPRSCAPANTVLEVTTREAPTATVTHVSAFTPTGCTSGSVARAYPDLTWLFLG
jgi:hypothetical protein